MRLLGEAAVGRGERLPLAAGVVASLGEGHALGPRLAAASAVEEVGRIFCSSGTANGSSSTGVSYSTCQWAGGRSSRRSAGRGARWRVASGDADGLAGDAVRLGGGAQAARRWRSPRRRRRGREAPKPSVLAGGDALDPASYLMAIDSSNAADDARVGVLGAEMGGRIQVWLVRSRIGRPRVAEGSETAYRSNAVSTSDALRATLQ